MNRSFLTFGILMLLCAGAASAVDDATQKRAEQKAERIVKT